MRRLHRPFVVAETEDGSRKFVWLGLDEADAEKGVLTNQYLLVSDGKGLLIDPGGYFVFNRVLEAVSEFLDPADVVGVFYSHQDPDIIGSLNLIVDFFPNAEIYVSELWVRFLPHLGATAGLRLRPIPDDGMSIEVGKRPVRFIPAHFLHSPGNFTLYDPETRVLFTSDIGASVFPPGVWYLFVEDFEDHTRYMEPFHRRYLASMKAVRLWLNRVKGLEIDVVAPQHGALMQGENARKFLQWLEALGAVGLDLMG